jgi:SAM-dependent methyltransferase
LAKECQGYTASQFFADATPGEMRHGVRSENLESLSLPTASCDLIVTQDVLEHIFDVDAAVREIARVLRPGGAHVLQYR